MQGEISHQAPPLMAQLYFYCKISITPAVQGTACLLHWFPLPVFATVNSLLVLDMLDHLQRKLLTACPPMISAEHYFLGFMNFIAMGHRGPRQGTCLKSQRPRLEDSWTASCICGTPVQPLSQGLCGVGKVGLGNPNWPAVT